MEQAARADLEPMIEEDGLSADEIASFLDGKLEGEELDRVESYLADNPEARQELIKASRIVSTAPPVHVVRRRPAWLYPAVGLAAAAALFVSLRPPPTAVTDRTATERTASIESSEHVQLVSPANGQHVERNAAPFVWRSYASGTYHFTLTDESGVILFDTTTQDTAVVLDPSISATAKGKLYWTVDAQGQNGASIRSALSELEFVPLK